MPEEMEEEQQNSENEVKLERLEDEHKEDTKVDTMKKNVELEETNIVMPNKTDEQKTVEELVKQEQDIERPEQQQQHLEINRNEPIYENIKSTISMQQVDIEQTANTSMIRRNHIENIPNKSNNNNNNEHNQTNNNKSSNNNSSNNNSSSCQIESNSKTAADLEPYYQVPKATEPYYDAPKHLRPIPVYENIDIFYTGLELGHCVTSLTPALEPPKEKPPPPPTEPPSEEINKVSLSAHDDDLDTGTWSSDNTYETISSRSRHQLQGMPTSPPIKRMNSTKRIKKELRNKRSSFLGIETDAGLDDVDSYLQLTVATPPDMAQLLQEERRLEKQLYIKAGLCDSSDTGERWGGLRAKGYGLWG